MFKNKDHLSGIVVSLLFAMTFLTAGSSKLLSGSMPDWFRGQFEKTLFNQFSGSLEIIFYSLALLEVGVGLISIVSLLPRFRYLRFYVLLSGSFTFLLLALGQRLTHKYEEAGILFLSAMVTYIALKFEERKNL